jgi:hypothetical protein
VPNGIMLVQSRPTSSDDAGEYHRWYDEVHIPELLAVSGFRSARRLRASDGESYVAIYEVDDLDAAKAALAEAQDGGVMTRPVGVQLDPPPTVQWFEDFSVS